MELIRKYNYNGGPYSRRRSLFADFHNLQRICSHPRVLHYHCNNSKTKVNQIGNKNKFTCTTNKFYIQSQTVDVFIDNDYVDNNDDFNAEEINEDSIDDSDSDGGLIRRNRKNVKQHENIQKKKVNLLEWWKPLCTDQDLDTLNHSSKLTVLFSILQECENLGEKLLVFTQSLNSLDVIEYFLQSINNNSQEGSWIRGHDYFRLDGSTKSESRETLYNSFNDGNNKRARYVI